MSYQYIYSYFKENGKSKLNLLRYSMIMLNSIYHIKCDYIYRRRRTYGYKRTNIT